MALSYYVMGVDMEKLNKDTSVTTTELAAIFGVTARRIQQMTQDGTFQQVKRGHFNLKGAIEAWVEYRNKDESTVVIAAAKRTKEESEARLKAAKADMEELKAKELRGKMHRSEDVQEIMEDMIFTIRSGLMALPGRVSVDAFACDSAAEVSDVITKEVHKIMRELAGYRYDPEQYAERVREREKWEYMNEEENDD